jgi:hypothetical protein
VSHTSIYIETENLIGDLGLSLEYSSGSGQSHGARNGQIVICQIAEGSSVFQSKIDVAQGDAIVAVDGNEVDVNVHTAREVQAWMRGR